MAEIPREILQDFPNPAHVRDVCRPGTDQCRFLVEEDGRYKCGRGMEISIYLVSNTRSPVNCGGILSQPPRTLSRMWVGNQCMF